MPASRRGAAGRTLVAVAATAALVLGAVPSMTAHAASVPGVSLAAQSKVVLPADLSDTMPVLDRYEAVGDYLGLGHDQRAVIQDNNLEIFDSPQDGGQMLRSTPTDLRPLSNGPDASFLSPWEHCIFQACNYGERADQYSLNSMQIASDRSDIFITGSTDPDGYDRDHHLYLYELPHDGSCAVRSCVERQVSLPTIFDTTYGISSVRRLVTATSLAVGQVGGQTLIAVGLSDYGIMIFNHNLQLVSQITDMDDPDRNQTPVISLAFGPAAGPGEGGLLVGGVMSPWLNLYSWTLDPHGKETSMARAGGGGGTSLSAPLPLSTAVADVGGKQRELYGMSDGNVWVLDSGNEFARVPPGPLRTGAVTGLTALTPWDGGPTNQELVLGARDGTGDEVLHYVDGALVAVPIGAGEATTATDAQMELWYPGYKAGRLRVANHTAETVTVALASRPDPGYGCWLDASVAGGAPAFPTEGAIGPGQVSPEYFAGALTAGVDGNCASAQGKGERSAYVVITPAGDRADEHLVKLLVDQQGVMTVSDQAGGDLTATVAKVAARPGAWGSWELTVSGGSPPAATVAPSVRGYRLTSAPAPDFVPPVTPLADDPRRPVYRFDVTGAQWAGVGTTGQVTALIPAMVAQGRVEGGPWQDLGRLQPSTAPSRAGDTITLGPASFYWQNPPGPSPLTEVRVVSGTLASPSVKLADLTSPPLNGGPGATPTQALAVTSTTPGGVATPRADGIDQASLAVQLTPSDAGGVILSSDPRYQLVYYRYAGTNSLVTGLYEPGDYSDYLAVGPWSGAYGAADNSGQVVDNYLVTTSAASQSVVGELNDSGTASAYASSPVEVAASRNPLRPTGTATGGIGLSGCSASPTATCTLATPSPTAPALYQAGGPADGPVTGLQLEVQAVTGRASLPLQVGTANAHGLATAPLAVTPSEAKLLDTSAFFPSDTVDTALVTSGELVAALSVPVGQG